MEKLAARTDISAEDQNKIKYYQSCASPTTDDLVAVLRKNLEDEKFQEIFLGCMKQDLDSEILAFRQAILEFFTPLLAAKYQDIPVLSHLSAWLATKTKDDEAKAAGYALQTNPQYLEPAEKTALQAIIRQHPQKLIESNDEKKIAAEISSLIRYPEYLTPEQMLALARFAGGHPAICSLSAQDNLFCGNVLRHNLRKTDLELYEEDFNLMLDFFVRAAKDQGTDKETPVAREEATEVLKKIYHEALPEKDVPKDIISTVTDRKVFTTYIDTQKQGLAEKLTNQFKLVKDIKKAASGKEFTVEVKTTTTAVRQLVNALDEKEICNYMDLKLTQTFTNVGAYDEKTFQETLSKGIGELLTAIKVPIFRKRYNELALFMKIKKVTDPEMLLSAGKLKLSKDDITEYVGAGGYLN